MWEGIPAPPLWWYPRQCTLVSVDFEGPEGSLDNCLCIDCSNPVHLENIHSWQRWQEWNCNEVSSGEEHYIKISPEMPWYSQLTYAQAAERESGNSIDATSSLSEDARKACDKAPGRPRLNNCQPFVSKKRFWGCVHPEERVEKSHLHTKFCMKPILTGSLQNLPCKF